MPFGTRNLPTSGICARHRATSNLVRPYISINRATAPFIFDSRMNQFTQFSDT